MQLLPVKVNYFREKRKSGKASLNNPSAVVNNPVYRQLKNCTFHPKKKDKE